MNFRFLSLILIIFFCQMEMAFAKKTVCSITINSDDEIRLFREHLSNKQSKNHPTNQLTEKVPEQVAAKWDFIELAPEQSAPENHNWFKQACEKKVSCDILVISGHFGGAFFGNSKLTLSIDDLESGSCEDSCQGIIHQPKEVFLFGCNTLASKDSDRRTPEEYMRDLRNDGFTYTQASQIVSFRYSEFGDSFKRRMALAFATVPRIYGFSSKAPLGKDISPSLKKYLKGSEGYYSEFESKGNSTQRNDKLFAALQGHSISQTSGSVLKLGSTLEKPYCFIKSPRIGRLDKLKYIEELFKGGRALALLSHIQRFLASLKKMDLSAEEKQILYGLSQNENIKADLVKVLDLVGDVYIPLKVSVLNTMKDLEIVNQDYVDQAFRNLINLGIPLSPARRDMVCSLGQPGLVPMGSIPQERWNDPEFLAVVLCLKMKSPDVQEKVAKILSTSRNSNMLSSAIWYFAELKTQNIGIQQQIAKLLHRHKDMGVRLSAALVLNMLKPTDPEVQREILDSILSERSKNVVLPLLKLIKESSVDPVLLHHKLVQVNQAPLKELILETIGSDKKLGPIRD